MKFNQQEAQNKFPRTVSWIIIALCVLPYLVSHLGINFGLNPISLTSEMAAKMTNDQLSAAIYAAMSGAFSHTILEWSAFMLSLVTLVFAFIHYRLVKDVAVPIICLVLFFSGVLDAFHTLASDRLIAGNAAITNLSPFTWAAARLFNAVLMLICVGVFSIERLAIRKIPMGALAIATIVLIILAYGLMMYMSTSIILPQTQFPNAFISRPYDVAPLILYLLALIFLYPRFYKMYPTPFAQSLILTAFVGMSVEAYMAFGSGHLFDANFNIAHFLKALSYSVPLIGLLVDYVQTYRNVHITHTQLSKQTEELSQLAHYDYLTDLHNRATFEKTLESEISRASHFDMKFGLLFIDLDNFKKINDDLGHNIGDIYLKEVAKRLKKCVRETDTIARIGGDEFALIIEGIEHNRQASIVAKKIFKEFSKEYVIGNRTLSISASIGIACFPEAGSGVVQLCKHADIAMYCAKEHGKRQWQFFTAELSEKFNRLLHLENALSDALENNEFYIQYQPQYNIVDNIIIGVEVLLRWRHPELGEISPEVFVPIAEEMGIISVIGSWVLESSCPEFKAWSAINKSKGLGFDFAVNISTHQLTDHSFMRTLKKLIAQYKFNPMDITIELTETTIMTKKFMLENLNEIADLGVRIAIDDFGTGYSSLSYLRELPIQIVKIDKSFLDDVLIDESAEKIVKSIVAMVQNLDLEVVAEGVENSGQKQFLINNGCHIAQGFYLSRPLSAEKISHLLTQQIVDS